MLLHLGADQRADFRQKFLAHLTAALDGLLHFLEGIRLEMTERQVLELAANFPHSQAVGDGGINLERLSRNAFALFGRQVFKGPHVVEPVGQLHQHHPDVIDHGQDHFAKVFGLLVLGRDKLEAADLRHAFDDARHVDAEFLLHPLNGNRSVFDHIVQHAGGQTHHVQLHVGQHVRDFQGMRNKGFSRKPLLCFVFADDELVGFAQQGQVITRARSLDLANDLFEVQHPYFAF